MNTSTEFWEKKIMMSVDINSDMMHEFIKLTGDDAPHHISMESANALGYENILVQGLLVLSLTGRASSQYLIEINRGGVTYGYDQIRFIKPIYTETNLQILYEPKNINQKNIVTSRISILNKLGEKVLVADHLLKLL